MQNRRLTLNGLTTPNFIYLILSLGMVGVSTYLTNHFYETHFPTNLTGDSFCSISEFWGCDKATLSMFGSIFNVPTAFFGIVIGAMGIFGIIFSSEEFEKTLKSFSYINAIGCLLLLIYSLVVLGSLCPLCTIYYILSFASAFLFYRYSSASLALDLRWTVIFTVLTIIPAFFMHGNFKGRVAAQRNLNDQYIVQYFKLAIPGDPIVESPYKVYKSTEAFVDAPIRISLFSDFECPFCQVVAKQMEELISIYKGKINIQYMFYPLDGSCNSAIKGAFHKHACKAAYLAACDKDKFSEVHDYIFSKQKELSFENITKWQKEFKLKNCFNNKAIQEEVQKTLLAGNQYNIQSTPTMILNGRKLEGSVKTVHLKAILDEIIRRSQE